MKKICLLVAILIFSCEKRVPAGFVGKTKSGYILTEGQTYMPANKVEGYPLSTSVLVEVPHPRSDGSIGGIRSIYIRIFIPTDTEAEKAWSAAKTMRTSVSRIETIVQERAIRENWTTAQNGSKISFFSLKF